MTPKLFTPLTLRALDLRNRIVIAPMCQYSATDGLAGDWHRVHLGQLAISGAGLLCLEATAVSADGRISPGCLGLWNDVQEAALADVLRGVRAWSPIALGLQISHAGRKGSCAAPWLGGRQLPMDAGGWPTVAPSPQPLYDTDRPPQALTPADLAAIRDQFVATAQRADRLGIDLLEMHAAHGYLLHQFLSPLANRRDDAYGGSLENRMRFPLEVFTALRAAWPAHKPLGVRISATDWVAGGWDLAQSIVFAQAVRTLGADFIDVSSGGLDARQQVVTGPGYQLGFAAEIRAASGLVTIGVGQITTPRQAEAALADGQADLVALARGILYNPRWPWHAAAELGAMVSAPPQYWRADLSPGGALFAPQQVTAPR